MGGHFVCEYEPLEARRARLERRYRAMFWPAFLLDFVLYRAWPKTPFANKAYFALTGGRNRALSKAELWGRLSFCGLKVVHEEEVEGLRLVVAQKTARRSRTKSLRFIR